MDIPTNLNPDLRHVGPPERSPEPLSKALLSETRDAVWKHIDSTEARYKLTQACSIFRRTFLSEVKIEELMYRVVWGNQARAKALLQEAEDNEAKLSLLLCRKVNNPVKDPSGKPVTGLTPFQAALCTGNERLCELFKSYFEQIPEGLEKMQAQIKKIFPEGIEAHIKKQKKAALEFKDKTLRPLIAVMSANTTSEADVKAMLKEKRADSLLGKAIAAFREEIKKLSGEDPLSNPFYLQEAYNLYEECFATFRTWDQRTLFCIQGIGYLQCYSPACDLQAFAQGLYYLVEQGKTFLGSFKFTHVLEGVTHLEIKMKDFSGLGFDYCAARGGCGARGWRGVAPAAARLFEIFIKQKQQALRSLWGECSNQRAVP